MAALDLTDKATVLAWLVSQLPNEDATVLEALLVASAGSAKADCDDGDETATVTYRPFWLLANFLASNPSAFESVKSATGSAVAYRDPAGAHRALMLRQNALDQSLCSVPEGFEAVAPTGPGSRTLVRAYG